MTEVLGVLGFLISVVLGLVQIWQTFFRRSRFEAVVEWANSADGPVLEVNIANVGWKKDSIRAINFRTRYRDAADPHDREWLEWSIAGPTWDDVPVVLDVDEITPRQELPLQVLPYNQLKEDLIAGRAELIIVNARGKRTMCGVSPFGAGPPPP